MLLASFTMSACFSGKTMSMAGRGGEVVGVGGGKAFSEPAPYGMVRVDRGFLHMGLDKQDSLWGKTFRLTASGWMKPRSRTPNTSSL